MHTSNHPEHVDSLRREQGQIACASVGCACLIAMLRAGFYPSQGRELGLGKTSFFSNFSYPLPYFLDYEVFLLTDFRS